MEMPLDTVCPTVDDVTHVMMGEMADAPFYSLMRQRVTRAAREMPLANADAAEAELARIERDGLLAQAQSYLASA